MEENPYQCPVTVDRSVSRRPGGLHLIGLGLLGGAFVGGTFGAIQGVLLALISIVAIVSRDAAVVMSAAVPAMVAVAILGALAGAVIGCVIGPTLGVMTALFGFDSIRLLFVVGVTAATFSAVIASVFAIQVTTPNPTSREYIAAIATGIASGFLAGMVLVRGLIRLARQENR